MSEAVAFQGEHGAWGEAALFQHFGEQVTARPVPTFENVFEAVAAGEVRAGVVPIENSLAGSILENYDLLLEHAALEICGEVRLPVRHCLLARPGVELGDVRHCYSHPQALAQSMPFLKQHSIEPRASYNTAVAARDVAAGDDPHAAAIAGARAAELYGLVVLAEGVQTRSDNNTRFLVIRRGEPGAEPANMASLVYTAPNIPGGLHRSLGAFAKLGLNLTKLESRPTRATPWEYYFYADIERADGALLDAAFLERLAGELDGVTEFVRVLGVYERGT